MSATEDLSASYRLIGEELKKRGYEMRQFDVARTELVEYVHPERCRWISEIDHMRYPLLDGASAKIVRDKSASYEIVDGLGLPTPFTRTVTEEDPLSDKEASLLLQKYPLLAVKPRQASLSNGLTLNVSTVRQLRDAITKAKEYDQGDGDALVQCQIDGDEVRFAILNGEVIAALLRQTPRIIGDGKQTVAELIAAENKERESISTSLVHYPQLDARMIDDQLLESKKVLPAGEVLELNRSTMIGDGASVYNVLPQVHGSYQEMAKKCTEAIGARFVVVDMFIVDYTVPHTRGGAYFNEFNSAPVLKLFYSTRDGKNIDIVPLLADSIDARLKVNIKA